MPISPKLKHFLILLYMVCCVFIAKAQQPLLYYINNENNWQLEELNYATGEKRIVAKFLEKPFNGARDRTAFDAHNGRYFLFSNCGGPCPNYYFYITEINISTNEVINYKLPGGSIFGPRNLFYDPITNSLVYLEYSLSGNNYSLNILKLESSAIEKFELQNPLNDSSAFISSLHASSYYNNINQEFILPYNANDSAGSFYYQRYDLKGNYNGLISSFKSKNIIQHISSIIWNSKLNSYYGIYNNSIFIKFKENGFDSINILTKYDFHQASNANKYDARNNNYYWFVADTNNNVKIYVTDTNFNQVNIHPWSGLFPEIHTFEKPYIRVEENAYTSTYGKSYRWLWNGKPVENSNNQTHEPKQCGWYSVEVTHLDGRVDTSDAVYHNMYDADGNEITGNFTVAYPNPFKNALNIRFKTCERNSVTFRIFDNVGKEVYSTTTGIVEAGDNEFNWNSRFQNLRYGMYFLHIYSGNELISTLKIVKN